MMTDAGSFAAVFAVLYVAHQFGDHWLQTCTQAAGKGQPGWPGRLACARHVTTYTAAGLLTLLAVAWLTSLHLHPGTLAAGLAVSAGTHYIADRRTPLRAIADRLGKSRFWMLGQPRPGRDDNPSLGSGAYALDQSWHISWLLVAALIIA